MMREIYDMKKLLIGDEKIRTYVDAALDQTKFIVDEHQSFTGRKIFEIDDTTRALVRQVERNEREFREMFELVNKQINFNAYELNNTRGEQQITEVYLNEILPVQINTQILRVVRGTCKDVS
jgi:hypothetical protein